MVHGDDSVNLKPESLSGTVHFSPLHKKEHCLKLGKSAAC